ncbi:signal peptidase I [Buchnera aphidicola (Cinara tujafilina)]|uniref:Signal peptidase I n=1 Tax=Buchnera aphidicola (Cinara tujafilina) TaxID=261317 RepID=F7WZU0_9GAMM|nr:signal peptidase I [Buchnera aphidicola]AEH39754.1 signal peptidase I [Buchnera aphidicola (Cinara tujafilina)]
MRQIIINILIIFTVSTGLIWISNYIYQIYNQYNIKNKNYEKCLIKKNWITDLAKFFPIIFLITIIRLFYYEPFHIPSDSMNPTLLTGDFILVNKFLYGIKNPINNKIWIKNYSPQRNDIIVFSYPFNKNINYIKRIIGMPGDIITYNPFTKKICIFKKDNQAITLEHNNHSNKLISISNNYKKIIKNLNRNNYKTYYTITLDYYNEKLHHQKHNIIISHGIKNYSFLYYKKLSGLKRFWVIPEKKYFVMGDNRDKSMDSRFWGLVSESDIIGKAQYIWLSINKYQNIWFKKIRLCRMFQKIK